MKSDIHSSKDKKIAFEKLRFEYFPLEDDQTIKAFKILEPTRADQTQLIFGREKDVKMDKRFLKTKFNSQGKSNYRSPYSTILWPDNERCYPSTKVQDFEKIMNFALKNYTDMFYQNKALANAFLKEINDTDDHVGIGLLSSDAKTTDKDDSSYVYKLWSKLFLRQANNSTKSVNLTFSIETKNQFVFGMEFKNCQEKVLIYGNSQVKRYYIDLYLYNIFC